MRPMGRGMPPPAVQEMDIGEIVEATRWIMRSNWGPDQNTSAAVATGIILGLRARDLTGKGQPVHVTMLNANAWTNADEYYDYANRPPIAMPDEEIHGLHALYRLYRCREGWVFLACLFQDEWATFCRPVQRHDRLADRRYRPAAARPATAAPRTADDPEAASGFSELAEPAGSEGPLAEMLAERGEGMLSISIEVDDIDAAVAELKSKGIEIADVVQGPLPDSRVARLAPGATHGVRLQLIERNS